MRILLIFFLLFLCMVQVIAVTSDSYRVDDTNLFSVGIQTAAIESTSTSYKIRSVLSPIDYPISNSPSYKLQSNYPKFFETSEAEAEVLISVGGTTTAIKGKEFNLTTEFFGLYVYISREQLFVILIIAFLMVFYLFRLYQKRKKGVKKEVISSAE